MLRLFPVSKYTKNDHQKGADAIEIKHINSVKQDENSHTHDENKQTNRCSCLNTSYITAPNPQDAPKTDTRGQK